jgi:hypothetical protein
MSSLSGASAGVGLLRELVILRVVRRTIPEPSGEVIEGGVDEGAGRGEETERLGGRKLVGQE